jgi:tetratricopeptide (TPR) repeat protein
MRYSDEAKETLAAMPVEDIEKLKAGVYDDQIVMQVLDQLSEESAEESQSRSLALMKLLFRSPQIDSFYPYDDILYALQDALVESGQGEALLHYALLAWMLFLRHDLEIQFFDYLNIARGFLYQGRGDVFAAYLKRALEETPLFDLFFTGLIKDFARLGELDLARDLNAVGQQAGMEGWSEVDLSAYESAKADPVSLDEGTRQVIRELITPRALTDDDEAFQSPALLARAELETKLSSETSDRDRLLWVPDMLAVVLREAQGLFDPVDVPVVKALAALQASTLPELSLLGASLTADRTPVFFFSNIGKTCGYHFDTVAAMAEDPELSPDVRADAAQALMAIVSDAPEHRAAVVEILEDLLNTPDSPDGAGETLVTGVVADLLDTDLYALKPVVARAFNEDMVSPVMIRPHKFTGPWDLPGLEEQPPVEGRLVYLECRRCRRIRQYAVDYALVINLEDLRWDAHSIFFDHLIECIKCGAVEDYRLSPFSMLQLFPALFLPGEMEDPTRGLDKMLYFIPKPEDLFFAGYSPVILDEIRRKVIGQGMDSLDALSQGEYYRVIGNFEASLAAFRRAYDADPGNRLAALALALAEHDYGDKDRARVLYRQAVGKGSGLAIRDDPISDVAVDGLAALADGERSPYPYPRNRDRRTLLQRKMGGKRRRRR